ncbi:ATP-binding cassette domain-containing protein [Spirochaeta cellobiosiphila]|uniref:ATP-binding cassette domain-containing protein n=1 Tax=Spirochaeta cellobiosiphila TaxID=504483 RepID=UPI00041D6938|nr:ATP-binding cassette domain-containing protein [Spirochaeta cellobiosiphila]
MSARQIQISNVTFSYPDSVKPVLLNINLTLTEGWTGLVGPNGSGKTTFVHLIGGQLPCSRGSINGHEQYKILLCSQETDQLPEGAEDFLYDPVGSGGRWRSLLGIGYDWLYRWDTLSLGEKKRFQLGILMAQDPDVLILDEPFNYLDREGREEIYRALESYSGLGLLIAHDRYALDRICQQCLYFDGGQVSLRSGNYSESSEQMAMEADSHRQQRQNFREQYNHLNKVAKQMKSRETGRNHKMSKKGLSSKDHDNKAKIDGYRLLGKDKRASQKIKHLEDRAAAIKDQLEGDASFKDLEDRQAFFKQTISKGDSFIQLEPGELRLSDDLVLTWPELSWGRSDKIHLAGSNGSGKTSFLKYLESIIEYSKGYWLPQELSLEDKNTLLVTLRALRKDKQQEFLTLLSYWGIEPDYYLAKKDFSPGEWVKIQLSFVLSQDISLLVMDEPTNHLDIKAIEHLEEALQTYGGALMLVSHDAELARVSTNKKWIIEKISPEIFSINKEIL